MFLSSVPMVLTALALLQQSCGPLAPLPTRRSTSQRIAEFPVKGPPLRGPATVYWNDYMVPYVETAHDDDLPVVLGMVHAHLRLGQMELFRRASRGRLSELAGPLAVDVDYTIRLIGFDYAADDILGNMDPETRRWLEAFVRGVNHYIRAAPRLPQEFRVFGIDPEPWTVRDLVVMGRLFSADVNWLNWFNFLKLMEEPGWRSFWQRLGEEYRDAAVSFGVSNRGNRGAAGAFHDILAGGTRSGSNCFVLAPRLTERGCAVIASDPHLGFSLPNLWLIAGFSSPGHNAVGFMLPGLPFVTLGRNPSIAWGGTNMRSASSSLVDVSGTDEAQLVSRKGVIRVRWWKDCTVTVRRSSWGPVISDSPLFRAPPGKRYALKWAGHGFSDEFRSFFAMNRARDWDSFVRAFRGYAVSGQNFLYADTRGNIGQLLAVRLPRRPEGFPARFTEEPAEAAVYWKNELDALDLPRSYNPKEGFLVSANNRPAPSPWAIGYYFSSSDRVLRITELIEQTAPVSRDDIRTIQTDVYSHSSFRLKKYIIETITATGMDKELPVRQDRLFRAMKAWDGRYNHASSGTLAFYLTAGFLVADYYAEKYGEKFRAYFLNAETSIDMIREDLSKEPAGRVRKLMAAALEKACGPYEKYKTWGGIHHMLIAHPLGRVPVLGRKYRVERFPADGYSTTVAKTSYGFTDKQHVANYGAQSRHISFMDDPDDNYFVLLGGQDGDLGGANLADQLKLWKDGKYMRVPLRPETVRKDFLHTSVIHPAGR